jgi:hypothetical protein
MSKQRKGEYPDSEQARRRIAEAFRKLADGRRFTPAERVEFAQMADGWASTLPKKKSVH